MIELIKAENETITSRAIAEITGKQHSNVMQDVRNLIEQIGLLAGLNFKLGSYIDSQNQVRPQFELTKKEALLLASGYNPVLRLKIIDRLEFLELRKPRTHLEIARSEVALLEQKEISDKLIEELNLKIKTDTPKVVFADSVIGSSNSILVRQFAKDLCDKGFEIGEKRLFDWFRINKYLNDKNEPYQNFVQMQLFEVITRTIGSGTETFTTKTTKITGKGSIYFAEKIKIKNAIVCQN